MIDRFLRAANAAAQVDARQLLCALCEMDKTIEAFPVGSERAGVPAWVRQERGIEKNGGGEPILADRFLRVPGYKSSPPTQTSRFEVNLDAAELLTDASHLLYQTRRL